MKKSASQTQFDRFAAATKHILAVPKKDLSLKASNPKRPKSSKS
jgi:hypothetical protein